MQKRFTIFEGYLLSHTLSQWLYCMKIVQLAVDKMMRVEIWIEFHLYRPDISCDPDRLRERVKKKTFQYILIIRVFFQIWQHLECLEVKVEFCPGFLIIIFLSRTYLASSVVVWDFCLYTAAMLNTFLEIHTVYR